MLTAKQYSVLTGSPYSTVMSWLQNDLIPGATKEELPIGGWFYLVPADAPRPVTRRGPKKKTQADADDQPKRAKRAKKVARKSQKSKI